ncbi:copper amine oxidase domain protein [[Eubacterium] yurii subsp. margaretiae ATCC 43715]|nr:copper amine oxidase domain protein [[Eubacterium] yurii subsp. margaretiae ATCC 43715]
MKKKIISLICGVFLISSSAFAAPETVKVIVNGKELATDTPAVIRNSRTMVPFRALFDSLGATNITWDEPSQKVTGSDGATTISLTIGSREITVNGNTVPVDSPPVIINSRTMIPLSAVSTALGGKVDWNGVDYIATVTKSVAQSSTTPDAPQTAQVPDEDINNSVAPIFDDITSTNPNPDNTPTQPSVQNPATTPTTPSPSNQTPTNNNGNNFDNLLIPNPSTDKGITGYYAMEDLKRNKFMLNLKADKTAELINISSSDKVQGTYSYSNGSLTLNISTFKSVYTKENVSYNGSTLLLMKDSKSPTSGSTFVLLKTSEEEYKKYTKK